MNGRPAVPAAERWVAAFQAVLAVAWLTAGTRVGVAAPLALLHLAALALPALFAHVARRRGGAPWTLRELYPFLFIPVFWTELGLLHDLVTAPRFDAAVVALDRAVFGRNLQAWWAPAMPQLSEAMQALYAAYYVAVFLPPLVLALCGRRAALADAVRSLTATYLACYLVYVAFPVYGPLHTVPRFTDGIGGGAFFRLNDALHAFGDSRGTAFPSSHVAGAVAMAVVAARRFPRWLAALFAAEALAVCLSTVYTQNHYAIDVVAGLLVAGAVQLALLLARRPLPGMSRAWRPVAGARRPLPPCWHPAPDTRG